MKLQLLIPQYNETEDDAKKVILFIKQLLGNLYEMPQLAMQEVNNGN